MIDGVIDDLYAALGVPRNATTDQLREALERIRTTRPPTSPEYLEATQAYAVLGDPRLRAEYDAGRVVGTGAAQYFESSAPRRAARGRLEDRWALRQAGAMVAPLPPTQLRATWPFVFAAGNVSGFFLTVIGIRLALGHPIG